VDGGWWVGGGIRIVGAVWTAESRLRVCHWEDVRASSRGGVGMAEQFNDVH
jgi:hypothetical protein